MIFMIFESAFLHLHVIYAFLSSFCFMFIQVRYIILQYNTVDIAQFERYHSSKKNFNFFPQWGLLLKLL